MLQSNLTARYNARVVRLQKYLADLGIASRRTCEEYIKKGYIKVNGSVVQAMGVKIDPARDKVDVAPEIRKSQKTGFVYYVLHKPVGYVSTVSGTEGPKVTSLVPESRRLFPVGRLDKLTSGLIILTNDGRLTYRLTHPKFEKEKEYVVKVRETVTEERIRKLQEPFFIEGRKTQRPAVLPRGNHLLHVILREGRNRQIRRMCERAGLHIEKLKRIRLGSLTLDDLEPGAYRKLTEDEVQEMLGPQ